VTSILPQRRAIRISEVKDEKLLGEFKQRHAAVIDALGSYESWIKTTCCPLQTATFGIGKRHIRAEAALRRDVNTPLDQLLQIAIGPAQNQAAFTPCHEVDPSKTPQQSDDVAKTTLRRISCRSSVTHSAA